MATALSIGQDISKRKIFQACPLVVAFDRCGCFGVIPFICVCLLVEGAGCIRNFYAIGRPVIGGWDVFLPLMNTNILADVFDTGNGIFLCGYCFQRFQMGAIATVGDVMDLQGENRILVKETDNGRRIQEQIDDLKQLKQWYER